ncbi:MAG: glucose-6-phosphate isomerase [Planctomycetes bacterium]|nr:glucose-6-phosphate isomerase [Planctomycetota bacterium]
MLEGHNISLDLANTHASRVGAHGFDDAHFENLIHRTRGFRSRLNMERSEGQHSYLNLPHDFETLELALRMSAPRMGHFDDLVVLGIGGSSLGFLALHRALAPLGGVGVPVHIVDNTDPVLLADVASRINLKRTQFVVVSKSGGTLETVVGLGWFAHRLRAEGLKLSEHMLAVTDPEHGFLRKFADANDIDSLPIPAKVGGRFSVLSAAALLPAALAGIDVASLLEGAERAEKSARDGDLSRDWPARLGLIATDFCRERHKRNLVFMPYCSRLASTADWFVQLWDESLGKNKRTDGTTIEAGQAAIRAVGACDQHAQLQLFLEGPNDKFTLLLRVEKPVPDLHLTDFEFEHFDAGFLKGKALSQVINSQLAGTSQALAERSRPSATLSLQTLDASTFGALLMGLELATTYAGFAWGVNPYDQPSVELGKTISRKMLGG